ncbi:MAG TPA: hypothetical protein VLG69_04605 [Candidatus Andersenbacteria bacterium]|nr:hypothetical protein [Candidatus Andersenbacteria bacterium]
METREANRAQSQTGWVEWIVVGMIAAAILTICLWGSAKKMLGAGGSVKQTSVLENEE